MKNIFKNKTKKQKNTILISCVICLGIIMVGIGFSAYQNYLSIDGIEAIVRVDKDIRIMKVSVNESSTNVTSLEDYNVSNINFTANLIEEDSYIIYDVLIYNLGNTKMAIKEINSTNSNINVELLDYTLKEPICSNDECTLGVKKNIKVKVSYKSGKYNKDNTTINDTINFSFAQVANVTYNNVSDSTSLPNKAIVGDTFTTKITKENKVLLIKMNNKILLEGEYTYTNNTLTINNVTGDIEISLNDATIMKEKIIKANVSSGLESDIELIDLDNMTSDELNSNFSTPVKGKGLYRIKGITGESNAIIYRGGVINNFVKLGDDLWKITQVDEDGNLRLISDDVISISSLYNSSSISTITDAINNMKYENSTIKTNLDTWYQDNLKDYDSIIVNSKFCENFDYEEVKDESDNITSYSFVPYLNATNTYKPTLTCNTENIISNKIGLMSTEEFMLAGGAYSQETMYFYLYNSAITNGWYTLSPVSYDNTNKIAKIFTIDKNGSLSVTDGLTNELAIRPIITINGNIEMIGDGTKDNPYEIKEEKAFNTGDSIELGNNQNFYVISCDDDTTSLFAAYNLNVGDYQNSDIKEGIQDKTIRAWVDSETPNYGRTPYYDTQGDSSSGTTKLTAYLNNYKTYLEKTFKINIKSIDLLNRNDAITYLNMNSKETGFSSTSPYYSWMTYTTFWFKEESGLNGYVYYLNPQNRLLTANDVSGIRPIITVNTSELEQYVNNN